MGDVTAQQTFSSPKASSLAILSAYYPSLCFLWPELCGNPAQGMLQKLPTFLAQSWEACSKLFQLTNLRRLEISQDPKTGSTAPHRFLQADLKGKLISQTYPKPGFCSQQETPYGVIFSDLCLERGRRPREIVYQCAIVAAISPLQMKQIKKPFTATIPKWGSSCY